MAPGSNAKNEFAKRYARLLHTMMAYPMDSSLKGAWGEKSLLVCSFIWIELVLAAATAGTLSNIWYFLCEIK